MIILKGVGLHLVAILDTIKVAHRLHHFTWGQHPYEGQLNSCTPEFLKATSDSGASMILWLDFMKYGVVSSSELNTAVEFIARALGALPSQSCCFCIAPQMSSERRSGLREEWRLEWSVHPFHRMFKSPLFVLCTNQKVSGVSIYIRYYFQKRKDPVTCTNI